MASRSSPYVSAEEKTENARPTSASSASTEAGDRGHNHSSVERHHESIPQRAVKELRHAKEATVKATHAVADGAKRADRSLDDACAYTCGVDGCCGPKCDEGCVACCPAVEAVVLWCDSRATYDNSAMCCCFDEMDDGVPPFFRFTACPLDHRNKCFNENPRMRRWAEVGYPYFGRTRRLWMGIATITTIVSMMLTTWGLMALNTEPEIVRLTRWAWARGSDEYGNKATIFIGLRSMVIDYCTDGSQDCTTDNVEYGDVDCDNVYCDDCVDAAVNVQFGAFITWFTHIFALLGTVNRMRFSSDAPVQKLLGAVTDTWGVLALTYTIVSFRQVCYVEVMQEDYLGNYEIYRNHLGYGVFCYVACATFGLYRAVMHWLVPCPPKWFRAERLREWNASQRYTVEATKNIQRRYSALYKKSAPNGSGAATMNTQEARDFL
uniref:Uncharacterized protein n=1 Tax=Phaeomonas parva TaxID=124430 RepID=A0A6U4CB30_9STRA